MRTINRTVFVMVFVLVLMVSFVNAESVKMTFEGLTENECVGEYYNGGYGYDYITGLPKSGPGPNYGVTFLPDGKVLSSIDSDAGGSGNFGGEPSPNTAIWFQQGGAWMNVSGGFEGTLSFFYTNPNNPSKIYVYDGLNKTGNLLATLDLPLTPYNGAPDPTGGLSPFVQASVSFTGIAKSVDFGELANSAYVDDITLTLATAPVPGPVYAPVPGLIEAENYVLQGCSICAESSASAGNAVCNIDTKDWIDINVNVATAGIYNIVYRIYNSQSIGFIKLMRGSTVLNKTLIPEKRLWSRVKSSNFYLAAGEQTLRVYAERANNLKLDYIEFIGWHLF